MFLFSKFLKKCLWKILFNSSVLLVSENLQNQDIYCICLKIYFWSSVCVQFQLCLIFVILWIVAGSPAHGLSRQEYWMATLPFLQRIFPTAIEHASPVSPALAGGSLPLHYHSEPPSTIACNYRVDEQPIMNYCIIFIENHEQMGWHLLFIFFLYRLLLFKTPLYNVCFFQ